MKLHDVRVEFDVYSDRAAVCWEVGGARFHFWASVDGDTLNIRENTLHKNTPNGRTFNDGRPDYKHAALDQAAKCNRPMILEVLATIERDRLIAKGREVRQAQLDAEKAANEARHRERLIREAAPDLYAALRDIVRAEWTTVSLQSMTPQHRERLERARAALDKADAKLEQVAA